MDECKALTAGSGDGFGGPGRPDKAGDGGLGLVGGSEVAYEVGWCRLSLVETLVEHAWFQLLTNMIDCIL